MKSRTSLILALLKSGCDPAQILVKLALRKSLLGCDRVLDVGCGASLAMRYLGVRNPVGIEGYQPSLETAQRLNTHDKLVHGDVRDLMQHFQPRQFDACVALDVIEHLNKQDGLKLIEEMEKIARKRVILFTPSGFLPQSHSAKDDLQEHLSGWEPEEMERYGYQVTGLLGPKRLRGEYHALERRPRALWGIISFVCHFLWTRSHPRQAAAILCVKSLGGV
jgi:SAM-dependent methyltransferase